MKVVAEFCLNIEALDGKTRFTLDQLLTTESLPIREKHFAGNKELRRWPHHDDLSLPKIDKQKEREDESQMKRFLLPERVRKSNEPVGWYLLRLQARRHLFK